MNLKKLFLKISYYTNAQKGATAIEYGLIAALIAVAIIIAVSFVGSENARIHGEVADKITDASKDVVKNTE